MSGVPFRARSRASLLPYLHSCALVCALLGASHSSRAAVVINEIHYDPPEGQSLELVELHNTGSNPVDLSGWSLSSGVSFTIQDGVLMEAKGFIVIARDRDALIEAFGLAPERVLGPFGGSLDDDGERLELSDNQGAVVDSVRYEVKAPWDSRARGQGPSLQRVCAASVGGLSTNWIAEGSPTPLAATPAQACPPPGPPRPRIAINEIHYHSSNLNDEHEEFVELRNNGSIAVQLKGYSFSAGIRYDFQEDALVQPGETIAVCRDADYVKKTFGLARAYGNFTGQLSNDGERITLVDGSGVLVDSVRYEDQGEWPVVADGLGASLEKILPDAPSDDPMSWTASDAQAARNRQRAVARGKATSTILTFQLDQIGECLIDNLSVVDTENPAQNLVPNGTFDRGIGSVDFEGTHLASSWDPTGGTNGTGGLRLKSKSVPGGKMAQIIDGQANRAFIDLGSQIRIDGPTYELSFDFTFVSGWRGFTAAFLDSTPERGIYWRFDSKPGATPGRPNTAFSERLPPHVMNVSRSPREPRSTDSVTIQARVRSEAPITAVKLDYSVDLKPETTTIEGFDDGKHGDGEARDGVYGATLPAFPHNTIVTFQIRAEDSGGSVTLSPPASDPTGVHGYYVNDLRPPSLLPIHNILLEHDSKQKPRTVIDKLDCQHYWTGAFAFRGDLYSRVGIRMRGLSVCRTPKPYLKLRFQPGRDFDKRHKLDFQAIWTDKSLVRERLSWDLFRDIGYPSCKAEYVRLHANGQYYGLFTALEHPDSRMLKRNGLDPDGNLYKSIGSNEGADGGNTGAWEKKTNQNGDYSDLKSFLESLGASLISKLRVFFSGNVEEESLIEYQLGQILIGNFDFASHNHYLYHDPGTGKWIPMPWDLDLTFGKSGVFDDGEQIPGFSPWFSTSVDGEFQSYLLDRFFSDAGSWYRRAYLVRLFDTLQERFTEEFYEARLSSLKDLLFEEQKEDIVMWGRVTDQGGGQFPRDFLSNLARARHYVTERRQYLLRYLDQRSRFRGHERLLITEISYHPRGKDEKLEFVELWNPGDQPIDLSRWSIEGIPFVFPDGARADSNEIFVVAKNPVAFEGRYGRIAKVFGPYAGGLDNKGGTLRVRDKGPGYPARVDIVHYAAGDRWPRGADGSGRTLELTGVSAWRDNDVPENWRVSAADGGSPGFVEGIDSPRSRFYRGDSNSDGKTNLTDVLATLGYLYLGAGEPQCRAASDLNGDGKIQLDDALFLLRHLFQGAQDPVPFPGPGDCGLTPVDSCQVSNCS